MTAYIICTACQVGVIDDDAFALAHSICGALQLVPESIFLSEFLRIGFTDPTNPNLQPITTSFGGSKPGTKTPFGAPQSVAELFASTNTLTRKLLSRRLARRPSA